MNILKIGLLVGAVLYGIYILLRTKHKFSSDHQKLADLKANANCYKVDFDSCVFKDSSYLREVEQSGSISILAANAIGDSMGAFHTPIVTKETTQSVLILEDETISDDKKFLQTFPMAIDTLKYHVLEGHLTLYIHKSDANKYFFELTS